MKSEDRGIEHYDVAVVGAGPAGSTCAYELGKAGKKVALFDHSHPREKPCGGAIPITLLKKFDLPPSLVDVAISYLFLKSPSGDGVWMYKKNVGALVMRKKLDGYLTKRASKFSDLFREKVLDFCSSGNGWIIKTPKRRVFADYVVGADGYPSLVRDKLLGPIPKKHLAHCVGYHLRHERRHISKHFKKGIEIHFHRLRGATGYSWVFPKKDYVTVGLGDWLGTPGLNERLNDFISSEKRFSPTEKIPHAHLLPVVRDPRFFDIPTSGTNWAIIGDAAGHVNPITGEGISLAMSDGRIVANAISADDLALYEKGWREATGSFLYLGARYQKLFYNPYVLNFSIKTAKKNKQLKKFLFELIFSLCLYSELLTYRAIPKYLRIFKEAAKKTLSIPPINITTKSTWR